MNTETPPIEDATDFESIGIDPAILKTLDKRNITVPTPIQHQTIPSVLEGKDIIGIAQTGTGKTFAFGLPMLQRLMKGKGRGLVVVPTRELAYQVEESLAPFASQIGIKMAVFVGGSPMYLQKKMLKKNPRILVATPGRLNDHLEQRTVSLNQVNVLVLDEADRMLDMGFKPQINQILKHVPKERQTLLFSATMPQEIFNLAKTEMKLPLRIEVAPQGTAATNVEQELIVVRQAEKTKLLITLLKEHNGSVLVFSRTKHGAKKITRTLNDNKIFAAEIHSNRTLPQRRAALAGFKNGKYRVLVATDIAARGIDVNNITVVINYDLPDDSVDYVHRIGRTGRAGKSGLAISFATPTQAKDVYNIEKLIKATLPRKSVDSIEPATLQSDGGKGSGGRRGGGGYRGSRRGARGGAKGGARGHRGGGKSKNFGGGKSSGGKKRW